MNPKESFRAWLRHQPSGAFIPLAPSRAGLRETAEKLRRVGPRSDDEDVYDWFARVRQGLLTRVSDTNILSLAEFRRRRPIIAKVLARCTAMAAKDTDDAAVWAVLPPRIPSDDGLLFVHLRIEGDRILGVVERRSPRAWRKYPDGRVLVVFGNLGDEADTACCEATFVEGKTSSTPLRVAGSNEDLRDRRDIRRLIAMGATIRSGV